jgi:hypothetical protein
MLEALRKNILTAAIIIVIFHPSLQDEFLNGQVNLFVLGATAAFFLLLEKRNIFWAAFFLAVATSIKIAPGLCLLYAVMSRQYRAILYFVPMLFLMTLGLPYLINDLTLDYYRYFVTDVMPNITGSDFNGGFRSFSAISTFSYIFRVHWYPPLKILAVCLLAVGLITPIILYARKRLATSDSSLRFVTFGAMVAVLPLTFPMSEAHHLLLQIIPFVSIVAYWRTVVREARRLYRDGLSVLFILASLGLHIGHGLKDTPIRLLSLIAIYAGMLWLLRKMGRPEWVRFQV